MYHRNRWVVLLLILAGLLLPACQQTPKAATKVEPAKIEKIEGSEFKRVTLTEKAAQRLGIETAQVQDAAASGAQRLVIPYAAVLYGLKGETWTYTNPEPLVFVREPVTVYSIKDDQATLVQGPPAGTAVVTVGGIELYGAETGVSK
jgi:hypothetical protein